MFGGVAAKVNGQMFAGLFGHGAIVRISPADQKIALALDGAELFDPMGNGRVMHHTVLLPESVMDEPEELRTWFRKALEHTVTLPPKKKAAMKEAASDEEEAGEGRSREEGSREQAAETASLSAR
jgi:TfoX/Sxy family transcriptional regulator of competence genes